MELSNIILTILFVILIYFFNRYLLNYFYKSKYKLLLDNDYKKPQAFHKDSTYRLGGTSIFFTLFLSFLFISFSQNIFYMEYTSFGIIFFILGLLDDIKINILPKFRLGEMILALISLLQIQLKLKRSGLLMLYQKVFFNLWKNKL